jgi:hypothetical protein
LLVTLTSFNIFPSFANNHPLNNPIGGRVPTLVLSILMTVIRGVCITFVAYRMSNGNTFYERDCHAIYEASRDYSYNRPAELHIYARGAHAFGMQKQGLTSDLWIEQFGEWLRFEGFLKTDRDK